MTKADKRVDFLLPSMAAGKPRAGKPMPAEQETPNPAPDKDYSDKQQPFTDDEENDPEIEDD